MLIMYRGPPGCNQYEHRFDFNEQNEDFLEKENSNREKGVIIHDLNTRNCIN